MADLGDALAAPDGLVSRFHAHDGWFFHRTPDGAVTIEVAESGQVDAPPLHGAQFDPDTWASIVAYVSAEGDNGRTWRAARDLHG